ncbi:MAG: DUF2231 domain-containing protein [Bdellovibrionota bacterium]
MPTMPLHPIIVHFPIALGLISPLLILGLWMGMMRRKWPAKTWLLVVGMHFILFASSLAAVKTGEMDEHKVEPYVTEQALEDHEELGEKMPWVFGTLLGASLLPLVFPRKQKALVTTTLVLSIASTAMIIPTGHTGGKLVYEHGAANAHVTSPPATKSDQD